MLTLENTPPSIKEVVIANAPSVYEGYLYKYTCIDTGKMYVGIHKGYVGDGYWHSSTDKEFQKMFADANANLKFEILQYGDYAEMTIEEHRILSNNDAKSNPLYINKTNGSPKYPSPDVESMKELARRIKAGDFNCEKESVEELYNLPKLQVRFEEDKELRKEIKEKIDDAGGNTDKCNPIIIYEGRHADGDIIGDGNHTLGGVYDSKHGQEVPVARIPKEVHSEFSNQELIGVSNLLNGKPEITKKAMTPADGVKYVVGAYNSGTPVESKSNKEFLEACNFTKNQIKTIIKNSHTEISKNNLAMSNQVWIDYKSKTHFTTLNDTVDGFKDKDTMAIYLSSGLFKWDHIFNYLYSNTQIDAKTKNVVKQKSNIVIVIHHPSPDYEKLWKSEKQPDAIRKLDYFLKPLGYNWRLHEMPTTISNGL